MNWSDLILTLRRHGHSDGKVAKAIGRNRRYVWDLVNGVTEEPKWDDGWALLDYASENLPREVLEGMR